MVALNKSYDSLELLVQSVEQMPYGVVATNPREKDNPIVYANEGFSKLTGYDSEEVLGRNCRFLQGDDRDQAGLLGLRQALEDTKPFSATLRNYRKDGSQFYNQLSVTPVHTSSGLFFVGFQTDVTQQAKERIRYQQASQSLEKSLARFAHQLNNRTARKAALLELLEQGISLDASQQELFDQLKGMVYEDKEFSSEQMSYLRESNQSLNVNRYELVDPVVELVKQYAPSASAQLEVHAQGPVFGFTNPSVYERAVDNLLSNAVKYTPQGRIDVRIGYEDTRAVVHVEDTGVGIPKSSLEDIFEPYNTVRYEQGIAPGHGIGLSAVRDELSSVNGTVSVKSDPGVGSVFTISLPRAD